jgi:hypothetical protein
MMLSSSQSILCKIVEAASDLIDHVVLSICPDPPDVTINPRQLSKRNDWLARYEAISDLNVITARRLSEINQDYPTKDRMPSCGFFIDSVKEAPSPGGEESFVGSMGCIVLVEGETFSRSLRELYEIQHAIRSILMLDKSLGHITHLGGLIDHIRWDNFTEPIMDIEEMRNPFISATWFYEIHFREHIYR